jgi:hypothetical protein
VVKALIRTPELTAERFFADGSFAGMLGAHGSAVKRPYTKTQGQYLAFIYYYAKLNGRPPAEADFQAYFRTTPPSVHTMILTLAGNGFIERSPGRPRSIRLLLPREELPDLE